MTVRLYRIIEHCHVVFTGSNPTGQYCVSTVRTCIYYFINYMILIQKHNPEWLNLEYHEILH